MEKKVIIFSAPSGSGKTTLVKELLTTGLNLEFSISACSRNPRQGEKNGVDYYFLSKEDFRKHVGQGDFLEWEEVYEGNFYGTFKTEIERIWKNGNHVIFDVDVKGGLNVKKYFGDKALSIFIKTPTVEELERRLRGRSTDPDEEIKKRIDKAKEELQYASEFDKIIVNDDLAKANKEVYQVVTSFLSGNTAGGA